MRYKISIYNEVTGQMLIRYITTAGNIKKYVETLWEETQQKAFDVVLIEPYNVWKKNQKTASGKQAFSVAKSRKQWCRLEWTMTSWSGWKSTRQTKDDL